MSEEPKLTDDEVVQRALAALHAAEGDVLDPREVGEPPCADLDTSFFFPSRGATKQGTEVQAFCATCPLKRSCYAWGVEVALGTTGFPTGHYGGMGADPRTKLRRRVRKMVRDGEPLDEVARHIVDSIDETMVVSETLGAQALRLVAADEAA